MIARGLLAALVVCALHASASGDPETDAETALRDAQQRAAAGDPAALDSLEALGARRPITRWTDDAWRVAALLAERSHDFARARRALEHVVATTDDAHVARRARADLERLAGIAGDTGEWTEVAAEHERLALRLRGRGDPVPALRELETLVREHPGYPRAPMVMLAIAQGWERDGSTERAIGWLHEAARAAATPTDRTRVIAELARALVRHGDLVGARRAIDGVGDRILAAELRERVAAAETRRTLRWLALAVLCAIAAAALIAARRAAGAWRHAARASLRPPAEAIYFAPVAAVFAAVAQTGNPLVAHAIVAIAIAGTAVAWVSGTLLELRAGSLRPRDLLLHGLLAVVAVLAAVYLAVDREQMIDLVIETWRGGPAMR